MRKTIKVVAAVCIDEHDCVLCALRSPIMPLPNLWEFAGGKVEKGEIPEESLVREIQEELGCLVQVHELIEDVSHEYPHVIVNLLTYRATIVEGAPKAKEHAQIKWVPLQELRSLKWAPADIPTVDKLLTDELSV